MDQTELAGAAGVSQSTVSRAENGEGVSLTSAQRLARALDTTVEALFGTTPVPSGALSDPSTSDGVVPASERRVA